MGSWSESCGFSGIEIGEGEEAFVAFLGTAKYRGESFGGSTFFEMRSPLLKGTYNDYGYLNVQDDEGVVALFNHMTGLSLQNGEDFQDRDAHAIEGLNRYWIRRDVFDSLLSLKPDFPYHYSRKTNKSIKFKKIGDGIELFDKEFQAALIEQEEIKKVWEQVMAVGYDKVPNEVRQLLHSRPLNELIGHSDTAINWFDLFAPEAPIAGVTTEDVMTVYRRHRILRYAASELRKKFVPSERGGPQHGGEEASCQFARAILKIQKERKSRWD